VDGEVVSSDDLPRLTVEIHGDVERVEAESCDTLTVHGKAGAVSVVSGNVFCGDVGGTVSTTSGTINRR